MRTSRRKPPPSPVVPASTSTPKTSISRRTATRAPEMAKTKMPTRSATTSETAGSADGHRARLPRARRATVRPGPAAGVGSPHTRHEVGRSTTTHGPPHAHRCERRREAPAPGERRRGGVHRRPRPPPSCRRARRQPASRSAPATWRTRWTAPSVPVTSRPASVPARRRRRSPRPPRPRVDRIMAFAAPVMAERAHVADRAQRSSVRRRAGDPGSVGGARTLGEAVAGAPALAQHRPRQRRVGRLAPRGRPLDADRRVRRHQAQRLRGRSPTTARATT